VKVVREVRGERSKTTGGRIFKAGGFKPGVKERGSYRCRLQSAESEEKDVMGEGIGE